MFEAYMSTSSLHPHVLWQHFVAFTLDAVFYDRVGGLASVQLVVLLDVP